MLRDGGILVGDEADIIAYGHAICRNRANGLSEDEVAQVIANHNPQIGPRGARLEIVAAETAYCPQYSTGPA